MPIYNPPPGGASTTPDLAQTLFAPTSDETIAASNSVVVMGEYIMDVSHETIFTDPSEMGVL